MTTEKAFHCPGCDKESMANPIGFVSDIARELGDWNSGHVPR